MTSRHVALLRGINVGRAKRISMTELTEVFESLGARGVRTHLNSGNVVFDGSVDVAALESAITDRTGVTCRVLVFTAVHFRRIAAENPLRAVSSDPSRSFVMFLETVPTSIDQPDGLDEPDGLDDEQFVLGAHAIYQWIPGGALSTKVTARFTRSLGLVTVRNLRTVDRLVELLD